MDVEHEWWMRIAIEEGERARGGTGDNPWVGCVIVSAEGELLGRGHTQGPGEDHAEIAAAGDARGRGFEIAGATLYSTLEPCAFHGRTPACSKSIARRGIATVVLGMHDPNPRVDGEGVRILRSAGVQVVEGICEADVRRRLGPWVVAHHPHDVRRRARELPAASRAHALAEAYGVEPDLIERLLSGAAR
jgi:diaminohydroxyphosphoribosylaminopyrimidine deaminase/5-amino-6-(5-phosphoribosylamino)uracil reductase